MGAYLVLKSTDLLRGRGTAIFFLKGGLQPHGQSGESEFLMGDVSNVSAMDVMPRACPISGEKAAF